MTRVRTVPGGLLVLAWTVSLSGCTGELMPAEADRNMTPAGRPQSGGSDDPTLDPQPDPTPDDPIRDDPVGDDDPDSGDPDPGDDTPDRPDLGFACTEPAPPAPAEPIRRFSRERYVNAVLDLTEDVFGRASPVHRTVADALIQVPADGGEPFTTQDDLVSQGHVQAWYDVARALGTAVHDPATLEAWLGDCATNGSTSDDAACIETFVGELGGRLFGRALEADEVAFFRDEVYGADRQAGASFEDATENVVVAILSAPDTLYRIEGRTQPMDGRVALNGTELARRLAAILWKTTPDAELVERARNLTEDQVPSLVRDMLEDPRAVRGLRAFVSDWLHLDEVPRLDAGLDDPAFAAFAGDDRPSARLHEDMVREVVDLFVHYTFVEPKGLHDILVSDRSFARTEELARVTGAPEVWDGTPDHVVRVAPERAGLFGRAALHVTGGVRTRPIKKGVRLYESVMCGSFSNPPNELPPPPELAPTLTTRERTAAITEQPDSSCATCHAIINPLGYVTENIDALGRLRTEETIFNDTGDVLAQVPIDSVARPIEFLGNAQPASHALELSRQLTETGRVDACVARQLVRYVFGRAETEADQCLMEELGTMMQDGAPFIDVLEHILSHPSFRSRSI
jgi:hypothetical protein